jgi:ribosomal protein S18 acetylase RimI-like enzyme
MINAMDINIERAKVADAQAILHLQVLAYQSEAKIYNNYAIPPLMQTLSEIEEEFRSHTFLVARQNQEIIGSVRAVCRDGCCYIGKLIVHPDLQRQGLGSRLMAAIEAAFPEAQYFELFTGHRSERNLRLYNRLGYREFKREQAAPGLQVVYLKKTNIGTSPNL